MVKIETVKDAATCSVIVVDHVVNLLREMGKMRKKKRVRGEESKLCSFFFRGYTVEPELLCLLIQSKDWRK